MQALAQEIIAFALVAAVAFYWSVRAARAFAVHGLSPWLLKRGRVKWAIRLRRLSGR